MRMADSWFVRTATTTDLLAVLGVHSRRHTTSDSIAPQRVLDQQLATWTQMMATKELSVYVVEDGDVAVGTLSMVIVPNLTYECRPTAFIEPVLVVASHRRRGAGRAMLRRALSDARAAGCLKVQVVSHKRHVNDGAHAFYVALGFKAQAEGFRLYLDATSGNQQ